MLTLFSTYLIYPLLGLVVIVLAALIARKNNLLRNKRLITYTLLSCIILALPGLLGFLDYNFMPYGYLASAGVYLILGFYNYRLLEWIFDNPEMKYRVKISYILFQTAVSMLLFAMIFNLCSELKYGLWASTSMLIYLLPVLLIRSYELFIHIPALIYKIWDYGSGSAYPASENLDHSNLKVVSIELFKQEEDPQPIRVNAKVPDTMLLGEWIKLFFQDYNKRFTNSPINVYGGDGWIFYTKKTFLSPRHYLDYELTVGENRIADNNLIIAKRVKNNIIDR